MARLRYNALKTGSAGSGVPLSLGASLTSSATSITFNAALTHSNGTAVPTISSPDYIPLEILDTSGNMLEIVYLTAYTAAATTGTIARGKEGTSGVAHSSGDKVVGAVLSGDILGDHGARVKKDGTPQSLTSGSVTAVTWQTEDWDTDGYWTSGAPTRFTIPTGLGGRYTAGGGFTFDNAATFDQLVSVAVNGTEVPSTRNRQGSAFAHMRVSTILDLVPTDYVEFMGYQGSGTSKSTSTTANLCEFWLQKMT